MLRAFEPWHLLVIGGIAMLLFGAKRLPDSARSMGQSLRIFRSEVAAAKDGAGAETGTAPAAAPGQIAPVVAPAAPLATPMAAPVATPVSALVEEPVAASHHSGV